MLPIYTTPGARAVNPLEPMTIDQLEAIRGLVQIGETVQITHEVFDYFLEVLPPAWMSKKTFLPGYEAEHQCSFGFAEGAERVTAFWCESRGRPAPAFFCQITREWNPNA